MERIKKFLSVNWRGVTLAVLGVIMFFVYSWFPYTTSMPLYVCSDEELVNAGNLDISRPSQEITDIKGELNNLRKYFCARFGRPDGIYKFNSPDEMMNYFWTLRYSKGEELRYEDDLLQESNFLIRPRSTSAYENYVIPGSFMGMYFIYGNIGRAFSPLFSPDDFILYLTAVFAVFAVWVFYFLIKRVFDKNIAFISSLLLFTFPAYMYYASRSMYHNVLFLSLFIMSITAIIYSLNTNFNNRKRRLAGYIGGLAGGILLGFSLFARTSEVGWVILLVIFIFLFHIRKFFDFSNRRQVIYSWLWGVLFVCGVLISLTPLFGLNYKIYGRPLSVGYNINLPQSASDIYTQADVWFRLLVSPFGVDITSITLNAYNYLYKIYLPLSVFAFAGILLWLMRFVYKSIKRKVDFQTKKQFAYFISAVVITVYLAVFYGSWQIVDRIDNTTFSLGTSYTRYWLPVYVLWIPFISLAVLWIPRFTRRKFARPILSVIFVSLLIVYSFDLTFWKTDESLSHIRDNVKAQQAKMLRIKDVLKDENPVVILGFKQADKIFFPEYKRVIPQMVVNKDYEAVSRLVDKGVDVRYYHFAAKDDLRTISRRNFEPFGLKIDLDGYEITTREYLYRIFQDLAKNK